MILAHTYIEAWIVDCTPLTNEDIASFDNLIAKFLDTESLAVRLTTLVGKTDAFFMCQKINTPEK